MKKIILRSTLTAVGLCLMFGSAQAVVIDDAGAAKLKQELQQIIDKRMNMIKAQAGSNNAFQVIMDGELSVIPSGTYYSVTTPHASINFGTEARFDFGVVKSNIIPVSDEEWKISTSVPSSMKIYDKNDTAVLEFTIGSQKASSIWNPQLEFAPMFSSIYKDVRLKTLPNNNPDIPNIDLNIANLKAGLNLTKDGEGLWSGPNAFQMSNLSVKIEEADGFDVSIGEFSSRSDYDRINMDSALEMRNKVQDLTNTNSNQPTQEDVTDITNMMLSYFQNMGHGMHSNFNIRDLRANGTGGNTGVKNVSFNDLGFTFNMDGLDADNANIFLKTNIAGLKIDGMPVEMQDTMPTDTLFDINIAKLPFQKIMGMVSETMKASMQATDMPQAQKKQMAMMQLMALPQTLGQAGTKITIDDTFIKTSALNTTLQGSATAQEGTAQGAVADFTLSISGLDALIAKMAQQAQTNPKIQQSMGMLSMLQMMGQANTAPDGQASRSYRFQLTADGQALLNSAPLGPMIGGMMGGGRH